MTMFGGRNNRFLAVVGVLVVVIYYSSTRISGRPSFYSWRSSNSAPIQWKDLKFNYRPKFVTPLPIGRMENMPQVQYSFKPETSEDTRRRQERLFAVKTTFTRCWQAYKQHAWRADELQPVSGAAKNNFAGWGASLVDNLDTLWIMDMKDEFEAAVQAALEIRFDQSTLQEVNVFETTIRYLGGFLSAYDLSNDPRLLDKAVELGDMLLHAFDTPNHLPITRWHFQDAIQKKPQEAHETVLIAELGSLGMEFTKLSQATGDARYYSRIANITLNLAAQQNSTKLPGMWPVVVNARSVNFTEGNSFTLGGMADSVYEYLPKMYALLGGRAEMYGDMYRTFSATAMAHNIRRPITPDNADILLAIDIIVTETGNYLHEQGQHLSCFAGGMFALAGQLLSLPAHVDVGRRLTDGCVWAYSAFPTGIMPEIFTMGTCTTHLNGGTSASDAAAATRDCAWNATRWKEDILRQAGAAADNSIDLRGAVDVAAQRVIDAERLPPGFTTIKDKRYLLRPEAIESAFVLYRVTGDQKYLEHAWQMFEVVAKLSETKYAHGLIADVTVPKDRVQVQDTMESFWMAETLKYFYLIFSDPNLLSLDEWVFNTEAHPFRRPKGMNMMDHSRTHDNRPGLVHGNKVPDVGPVVDTGGDFAEAGSTNLGIGAGLAGTAGGGADFGAAGGAAPGV